jgi:hypothetical protein
VKCLDMKRIISHYTLNTELPYVGPEIRSVLTVENQQTFPLRLHLMELAEFATELRLSVVNMTAVEADRAICDEKQCKLVVDDRTIVPDPDTMACSHCVWILGTVSRVLLRYCC